MGSGVFNLDDSADRADLKSLIAVQRAGEGVIITVIFQGV